MEPRAFNGRIISRGENIPVLKSMEYLWPLWIMVFLSRNLNSIFPQTITVKNWRKLKPRFPSQCSRVQNNYVTSGSTESSPLFQFHKTSSQVIQWLWWLQVFISSKWIHTLGKINFIRKNDTIQSKKDWDKEKNNVYFVLKTMLILRQFNFGLSKYSLFGV